MNRMGASAISERDVAAFELDGAIILRGVFGDWVDLVRSGVEKNIADPGRYAKHYAEDGNSAVFFHDYCNWDRIPEYREFLFESPAAEIAAALTNSKTVRLFHEHVLVKEPGAGTPTPWHHDQPYYCVDGAQTCSLWLALDPVPRETSIEYVAGSHVWGRWFRPERFNKEPLYEEDGWEPVPDIDAHRAEYRILGWNIEPGDAIAFNFLTVHGAPPNRSPTLRRRAFSSRWIGDDTRFAVRAGETSPPFPGLTLEHGDPMDAPEFPVVFPR